MPAHYRIVFRDKNNRNLGEAGPGEWNQLNVALHWSDIHIAQLALSRKATIRRKLSQVYGMAVYRDDRVLMSGPIAKRGYKYDVQASPTQTEFNSHERILKERSCYPSPLSAATPISGHPGSYTFSATNDVFPSSGSSGPAEDALYWYVNNNAGPGADPARQIPNLSLATSLSRGALVKDSLRFKKLLTALQDITFYDPSLGFQITEGTGGALTFSVVPSRDLTKSVVFSQGRGNLYDVEYDPERPIANAVIVLASGSGAGRVVYIAEDAASIALHGRIEAVATMQNTSDYDTLVTQAQAYLNENANVYSMKLFLRPTGMAQLGTDWWLGDKVTATDPISGDSVQQIVRELHFTIDANGQEKIEPVLATPRKKHKLRKKNSIFKIGQDLDDLQTQS